MKMKQIGVKIFILFTHSVFSQPYYFNKIQNSFIIGGEAFKNKVA
jgi:hypothetical protein